MEFIRRMTAAKGPFGWQGRMPRLKYFLRHVLIFFLLMFCLFAFAPIFFRAVSQETFAAGTFPLGVTLTLLVLNILLFSYSCVLNIKRMHDLNLSGRFAVVLYMINLAGTVFAFIVQSFVGLSKWQV